MTHCACFHLLSYKHASYESTWKWHESLRMKNLWKVHEIFRKTSGLKILTAKLRQPTICQDSVALYYRYPPWYWLWPEWPDVAFFRQKMLLFFGYFSAKLQKFRTAKILILAFLGKFPHLEILKIQIFALLKVNNNSFKVS